MTTSREATEGRRIAPAELRRAAQAFGLGVLLGLVFTAVTRSVAP